MRRIKTAVIEGVKPKALAIGSKDIREFDLQKWLATPLANKRTCLKCRRDFIRSRGDDQTKCIPCLHN